MVKTLMVAVGGMVGSVLRYGVTVLAQRLCGDAFPLGTLTVNTVGCFVVGVLLPLLDRQLLSSESRALLMVGLIGGFTTFSAFGFETVELARRGAVDLAFTNVALNVGLGLLAVWLGIQAGRAL